MTPVHEFMALSARLAADLSGLEAGILAAAALGIARDSRSFANRIGVAHALVLRDCVALEEAGLLVAERRETRTQRLYYGLTPRAEALLARARA